MASDPRSKLDIIYQEVLGEVSTLVERLETVAAQLVTASDKVDEAGPAQARAASAASVAAVREIKAEGAKVTDALASLAGEAKEAAQAVSGASRRLSAYVAVLGLLAGAIGGALVCVILSRFL
jgi:uncharacterized protein YukE